MIEKRVFILGAGSSIAISGGNFPTVNDFFISAQHLGLTKSPEFEEIKKFFLKSLGLNLSGRINIEDLFTHIEIELERFDSPEINKIRIQLLKLIREILIGLEKEIKNNLKLDEVLNQKWKIRETDTLITFNWDLLLDDMFERKNILNDHRKNYHVGYSLPQYRNFIKNLSVHSEFSIDHMSISDPYIKWDSSNGYILKLHGFVDWFHCINEKCRGWQKVFPLSKPLQTHNCSECHEPLENLLIPPILNKTYRQYSFIRRIWNLAAQEVRSATEIIVWGYSLPPTDFYSKWLLRQARTNLLKKMVIINPYLLLGKKDKKIRKSFLKNFSEIFNGIENLEITLYEFFDDYCKGLDIKKKYKLSI